MIIGRKVITFAGLAGIDYFLQIRNMIRERVGLVSLMLLTVQ